MTEIELHQPQMAVDLQTQIDYAKTVSVASMLPETYRNKPADIMLAVGLGSSMGLSPAESLYRISVIKGKPTASAELIAANVRKAGHKLRVITDEQAKSVTAQVIRADDPDFTFEVTRDMAWAQQMGLARNDNYSKQPLTMLQWRAITAVARLACPEALYGVTYTPEEVDYDDRPAAPAQPSTGADRMRGVLGQPPKEPEVVQPEGGDHESLLDTSSALAKAMFAAMGAAGITERDDRLKYAADVVGREIASSKELTEDDARAVLDALEADKAAS